MSGFCLSTPRGLPVHTRYTSYTAPKGPPLALELQSGKQVGVFDTGAMLQ